MANTQKSLFGKTSLPHSAPTTEMTSNVSSTNSADLWATNFLQLDLRGGQHQAKFWENHIPSLGELSMLNIGEYPNVGVESFLSWILQDNTPETYCLSQKSCEGILRRAKNRGKVLPEKLKTALEAQIARLNKV